MIIRDESSGLRERIGYKDIAKRYLELYQVLDEEKFVANMIFMLDEWEKEEGLKFEQLMPFDWDMVLKALKVLEVEVIIIS